MVTYEKISTLEKIENFNFLLNYLETSKLTPINIEGKHDKQNGSSKSRLQ